jgi:hypothetical protein
LGGTGTRHRTFGQAATKPDNPLLQKESETFLWIRMRIQIRIRIQPEEVMEKMQAYIKIIINRMTNQVITQVRTSILLLHLHKKRIADT